MNNLKYLLLKIKYCLCGRKKEIICDYFRKQGMIIGEGSNLCSNIMTPEPYLIKIGKNVTVSSDVQFVTHDNSISKIMPNMTDLFGRIVIGDNCFIGQRATLLYGVELQKNTIVATGSVVTKSFKFENIIIGGNPAKIICTWEEFKEKRFNNAFNIDGLDKLEKANIIQKSSLLVNK